MGNRIYGCDDCLAVCPWNKFAKKAQSIWQDLLPKYDRDQVKLARLLSFDEDEFRQFARKSPIKRTGYVRFMRNCLIAAGNSEDMALITLIKPFITHHEPILRMASIWALGELLPLTEWLALKKLHHDNEYDEGVKLEWERDYG